MCKGDVVGNKAGVGKKTLYLNRCEEPPQDACSQGTEHRTNQRKRDVSVLILLVDGLTFSLKVLLC